MERVRRLGPLQESFLVAEVNLFGTQFDNVEMNVQLPPHGWLPGLADFGIRTRYEAQVRARLIEHVGQERIEEIRWLVTIAAREWIRDEFGRLLELMKDLRLEEHEGLRLMVDYAFVDDVQSS